MGKIIAFANQKGGVGKTTTAINLAAALSERGKRVLLCDFDPQGNATSGFGVDPRSLETSVYDLIVSEDPDTKSGIVQTKWVDIIGANVNLAGAELDLIAMDHREARLKLVLDKVKDEYDYVFIDCPPSLGLLTLNCLCAADSFLVPLQCEYYALEGLSQLMTTVRMVKKNMNPKLSLEGVLLTMFDGRTNLSIQVVEEVKKHNMSIVDVEITKSRPSEGMRMSAILALQFKKKMAHENVMAFISEIPGVTSVEEL